jgi:ribosome assembly protein YihI (activator of Der GTPase)
MTVCIRDVKDIAKLVDDVFNRIGELDKLFTRLGNFTNLSVEEQKNIDACLEGSDLLSEAGNILHTLKNGMQNEGGVDSDEEGGEFDDEFLV